jgi:hypothetical protein
MLPFVIYLVGANVLLSTSLFASIVDRDPESIDVRYSRAWTLLPGRIHAQNLSIRGRDRNVEWLLDLDEADFDVSLLGLAKKRFACSRVHGRGIDFWVRRRLGAEPSSPREVADLPPIPGLGPYSLVPIGPPERSDWSDAEYPLWSIRLEHITAEDVRTIWIDHVRLEGSQRIDGRFYFKPLRVLDIGPATVRVARGALLRGSRTIADGLDGSSGVFTLSPLDLRAMSARTFLRHASFVGRGEVRFADAAELPLPLPGGMTARGAAIARGSMRVASGVLGPGTRLEISAPEVAVGGPRVDVAARVALLATVRTNTDGARELAIEGALSDLRARAGDDRATLLEAARVPVTGASTALDLAGTHPAPLEDVHGDIDVPHAEIDAGAAARAWFPANERITAAGRIGLEAHVRAWPAEQRASGNVALRSHLTAGVHGARASGVLELRAAVDAIDLAAKQVDGASLEIDLAGVAIEPAGPPGVARAATIAHVSARARSPHWALWRVPRDLRAHAAVSGGVIADARAFDALVPIGPLHWESDGATFDAEADATSNGPVVEGKLALRARRVGVATDEALRLAGDADLAGELAWDTNAKRLTLRDGRLTVTDVAGRWSDRRGSDFTVARVTLDARAARLDPSKPRLSDLAFHATLDRGRLPDARALAALLPEGAPPIESGSGWANAEFTYDGPRGWSAGWVDVGIGGAGVRLKDKHVKGDLRAVLALRSTDLAHGIFDTTGSHVELRELVLRGAPLDTPRGVADFAIDGALRLDSRPVFDAPVRCRAFDVGPVLEFFVPKGLVRVFVDLDDERRVGGSARFVADARRFAVLDVDARGGDLSAIGDFVTGGGHRVGAFVGAKGALSAGIDIDDRGGDVKLFGLDSWLARRAREIRRIAGVRPREDRCPETAVACR